MEEVVKLVQEYLINMNMRPEVVDLYFLIEGRRTQAMSCVNENFRSIFIYK